MSKNNKKKLFVNLFSIFKAYSNSTHFSVMSQESNSPILYPPFFVVHPYVFQ